ncbi:hypothetical protein RchiOBHm_Chr6g0247761 [Rosa chinensis]|uniref:Uncharacterized protein n=1 Tax=Rosa chinensis TaxID=74649 RepID=A0A2P6PJV5_ROSCH|nr:hypothetical protein RchiOBHm_Chr6g0247761 [Rosa chinensis]
MFFFFLRIIHLCYFTKPHSPTIFISSSNPATGLVQSYYYTHTCPVLLLHSSSPNPATLLVIA